MKNLFKRLMLGTLVLTTGVSQAAWFENISIKRTSAKVAAVVAIGAAVYGLWNCYKYVKAVNEFYARVHQRCRHIDGFLEEKRAKKAADAANMTHQKDQMQLDPKPVNGLDQAAPTQSDTSVVHTNSAAQSYQSDQSKLL